MSAHQLMIHIFPLPEQKCLRLGETVPEAFFTTRRSDREGRSRLVGGQGRRVDQRTSKHLLWFQLNLKRNSGKPRRSVLATSLIRPLQAGCLTSSRLDKGVNVRSCRPRIPRARSGHLACRSCAEDSNPSSISSVGTFSDKPAG